jgi:hypothetical protein
MTAYPLDCLFVGLEVGPGSGESMLILVCSDLAQRMVEFNHVLHYKTKIGIVLRDIKYPARLLQADGKSSPAPVNPWTCSSCESHE